ncbi:hypothetical protein ACFVGY_26925 [Streptomyces sp. NPDC127106]|uniref:hypothetical protein n=1 Tax=Streptomyces sp. NPDC127106 TaxID=3345360 RepID=UPI003636FB7A
MTEHHTTDTAPQGPGPAEQPPAAEPAAEPPAAEPPPAAEAAASAAPEPAAPGGRRRTGTALCWLAAAVAFAAFGAGTAYGITRAERTDLPGLTTAGDGRWDYPVLAKPTLAPGAPQPFAADNKDGIHYAALFQLLLPAPAGSAPDKEFKVEQDQKVSEDAFLEEFEPTVRAKMKQEFTDEGLRQIVGRGWTMPDGTRTRVYLLRFASSGFTEGRERCGINMNVKGVNRIDEDEQWVKAKLAQPRPGRDAPELFAEAQPVGDEEVRIGCVRAGDVQAAVFQSRKGSVAGVPFHQTVILQGQLLG